jgi:hypothetical protein
LADPTYDWSGLYVGVNAGGAWGTLHSRTTTDFNLAPLGGPLVYLVSGLDSFGTLAAAGAQDLKTSSIIAGGQVGYNWQRSGLVIGVESDMDYIHLRGSDPRTLPLRTQSWADCSR